MCVCILISGDEAVLHKRRLETCIDILIAMSDEPPRPLVAEVEEVFIVCDSVAIFPPPKWFRICEIINNYRV